MRSISAEDMQWKAKRPCFSALQSDKGHEASFRWSDAIERYFRDMIV
jgi:dTDP-4-dehydrorhamnose reductase